jgi:cellulose synthase (UDP-forming)
MVGWDAAGNTSCCGTSFLVRTGAIERIGGFPTESVTEDLLTALRLHASGARCVYLNETSSVGLAADSLSDHLNQRARWVFGAAQVALGEWGPLRRGRWPRRWLDCFDLGVRPGWTALVRQLLAWATMASLLLGVPFVSATLAQAFAYLGPLMAARCMYGWLTGGALLPIVSDVNHVICDLNVLRANAAALIRPQGGVFKVTDKGARRDRVRIHGALLAYHGAVAGLTAWAIARLVQMPGVSSSVLGFHLIWGVYQTVVFGLACMACVERPKYRSSERYPGGGELVTVTSRNGARKAEVQDICPEGAALVGLDLAPGERVTVSLADVGVISARVIRRTADGTHGIRFDADELQTVALIRKIYAGDRYVQPPVEWNLATATRGLVSRLVRASGVVMRRPRLHGRRRLANTAPSAPGVDTAAR